MLYLIGNGKEKSICFMDQQIMNTTDKIYVAGHRGLVGAALCRALSKNGYTEIVTAPRSELDLTDQHQVLTFFHEVRPDYVFVAAARVGGINANTMYPADFIRDNLQIQTNVIDGAYQSGAVKLLFLGSSCIYPKFAPQPMKEEHLLSGSLEPTNEWYAVAKIAGIKMCQAYRHQYGFDAIGVMPTNLYGPGDNFDLNNSHVLPALIRKFHEATKTGVDTVKLWGTGAPRREFLFVDDLAAACLFLMKTYSDEDIINIGSGQEVTIRELAGLVAEITGFTGAIRFDENMPDGSPRKLLDSSKLADRGFTPRTSLRQGIKLTYDWYLTHQCSTKV
jgi:GDP-L-fucose synthase